MLILPLAPVFCQKWRVVPSDISTCVTKFCRSCAWCLPWQSQVLHPFVCVGRPRGAWIYCRSFVNVYVPSYSLGYGGSSACSRWDGRLTKKQAECCHAHWLGYLLAVRIRQQLYILITVSLVLCALLSKGHNEYSVEPLKLKDGLKWWAVVVKYFIPKRTFTPAKNFEMISCPFLVSRFVDIPYGMTQLSTNTAVALFGITVVTGISLVSFINPSVRRISNRCQRSFSEIDSGCSIPEVHAVQRMEADVAASYDGLSYLALPRTDSQWLWFAQRCRYQVSITRVEVYHRAVSHFDDQWRQDSSPGYSTPGRNDTATAFCSAPFTRLCLVKTPFLLYEYPDPGLPTLFAACLQYNSFARLVTSLHVVIGHSLSVASDVCNTSGKTGPTAPIQSVPGYLAKCSRPFQLFGLWMSHSYRRYRYIIL